MSSVDYPPPPFPPGYYPGYAEPTEVEKLFKYNPSQGAAIAAAVVFGVFAIIQFWLYWRNRPNGYMLVLVATALFGECLGYIIRIVCMHHPSRGVYILTTLCILLSPCATAYVNYYVCGLVLAFTGMNVGCLRPQWISRVFLTSDIVTFLVQGFGGAMTISTNVNVENAGKNICTAGLAIQIASFALFIWVALCVQFMPRYGFRSCRTANLIFWTMHATTFMFLVRTIYRLIEFNQGVSGYAYTHEWTFYLGDTIPMGLAFAIYSLPPIHYGKCVNNLRAERADGGNGTGVDGPSVQLPAAPEKGAITTAPEQV